MELLMEKPLYWTDVCLYAPLRLLLLHSEAQPLLGKLTLPELNMVYGHGLLITVADSWGRRIAVRFKFCRTNESYVLTGDGWGHLVVNNGLAAGDVLSLWTWGRGMGGGGPGTGELVLSTLVERREDVWRMQRKPVEDRQEEAEADWLAFQVAERLIIPTANRVITGAFN